MTATPMEASLSGFPAWLREIDVSLPSAPHLVVVGNTNDDHLVPDSNGLVAARSTEDAILGVLRRAGYRTVLRFHPVSGVTALVDLDAGATEFMARVRTTTGPTTRDQKLGPPLGDADKAAAQVLGLLQALPSQPPTSALLIEGAARLAPEGSPSDPTFHQVMTVAEHHALASVVDRVPGPHRTSLHRAVVWVLDNDNDLPAWFVARRQVRVISVPQPTLGTRLADARIWVPVLPQAPADRASREALASRFSAATAGLPLRALREIARVAIDQSIPADRIEDAVRMFRIGVPDNPWHDPALIDRIREAVTGPKERRLDQLVLGQPRAVRQAIDILIRSTTGLSGAQTRSSAARPQGVMFFAGPTGVGKTELAKCLAELVFGQADAMVRFDMSEFSSEHSEARLIGSPPGYVDHGAGGELTNAVRQRPFSLFLFDEIDKAHPRILDKFLQILEDGRLTGGSGSTVHFSEALLVFTSNLGIYRESHGGARVAVVQPGEPFADVERKVLDSVRHHFTSVIGRPELLNRIGDNVIVFDFVSPDVSAQLVPRFMANVAQTVAATRDVRVSWSEEVEAAIRLRARERIEFGGRAVATAVETMFVNPLARALMGLESTQRDVHVCAISEDEGGWSVQVRAENRSLKC